jgi:hypothetical protein
LKISDKAGSEKVNKVPRGYPRSLFALNISTLAVLTLQGWTGDFVNLFAKFPDGPVTHSLNALTIALRGAGKMEVFHAIIGSILFALAVAILILAFRSASSRGSRISAAVGLWSLLSAAYGGVAFVFSGFLDGGNSAQMGGSYIAAYASFFLVLFFNKK